MQNIHESLKNSLKDAMRAKDQVRLDVIRGLLSGCTNELLSTGRTPQDTVTDEDANKVVKRTIKQLGKAVEQFEKGGRADLVNEYKAQIDILKEFAPIEE